MLMNTLTYHIRITVFLVCSLLFSATQLQAAFLVKKQAIDERLTTNKAVAEKLHTAHTLKNVFTSKGKHLFSRWAHIPGSDKKDWSKTSSMATAAMVLSIFGYASLAGAIAIAVTAYVWPLPAMCIVLSVASILFALISVILGGSAVADHPPKGIRRLAKAAMITSIVLLGLWAFIGLILVGAST